MRARSFAASLLLVAAAWCAIHLAVDGTNPHRPIQEQWRVSSHHHDAGRLPRRNTTGVADSVAALTALTIAGVVSLIEPREPLSPFLGSVFVPPRA